MASLNSHQLSRKRAKDREAQRIVRQKTKDYIQSLEKNLQQHVAEKQDFEDGIRGYQEKQTRLEREVTLWKNRASGIPFASPVVNQAGICGIPGNIQDSGKLSK